MEPPGDSIPTAPAPARERKPWDAWVITAFGVAVIAVFMVGQTAAVVVGLVVTKVLQPEADLEVLAVNAQHDGTILSFAVLAGSLPAALMTVFLAWLNPRETLAESLGWRPVTWRTAAACLAATALFVAITDGLTLVVGRNIVPEFMSRAYATAAFKPLLWLGVCIVGPIFEELLFRGFLLSGWAKIRVLGPRGAILLTAFVWAVIHLQYGLYELAQIFLLGLILGAMRWRTGSLWPPILCHMLLNVIATTEAMLLTAA